MANTQIIAVLRKLMARTPLTFIEREALSWVIAKLHVKLKDVQK